jgi:S1-C subfamily serine protease
MDLLDLGIIVLIASLAARGWYSGFLRQAGSLGGFGIGLLAGASLAPLLTKIVGSANFRATVAIAAVFGLALVCSGLGEWAGVVLGFHARRKRLGRVDEVAGSALGVIIGGVVVWLLASLVMRAPLPTALQQQIHRSAIVRALDQTLPAAPEVVARFGRLVAPNGFPTAFSGLEPSPAPPVTGPNADAINKAAAAGRAATVRIEGVGCGGVVEGSGFVAGPGLVATNAHVVSGIDHPVIFDAHGAHPATVVSFDADLDFAVLRATNLAAEPLKLAAANVPRGTVGAVLGYPGGGSFTVSPAAVLERQNAIGRNIYDRGSVRRDIYSLQAQVRPGNSGGPFITPDGVVVGVVFATSLTDSNVGYALTSAEVVPELEAAASHGVVSAGACAAE